MKIAYIMSRFPLLSETFILREMDEIEAQGGEIVLFPMICQDPDIQHHEVQRWIPRRNCIPFFSWEVFSYFLKSLITRPIKITGLFLKIAYWNLPSPRFLIRALSLFPKAILTARKIQEANVDHIHVHYATHPALIAYIVSTLEGVDYSITIHSHDIYDNHVMLKQKLGKAKFLITVSQYNVEYLSQLLGEKIREKTHVVHCGVNTKDYQPAAKSPASNLKATTILQVGSLHWKKGQTYLLEAAKLLKAKTPDFSLMIVGDGKERPHLEKLIEELSLQDTVTLLGAKTQAEVKELLPQADLYVQSSVSEGIPVAIMEALSCQLPVVATNITGIPELVIHEQTGVLVPPRDPEAIAEALFRFMQAPGEAAEFGKAGRDHVAEIFSLDKNVQELNAIFNRYLSS